jgi:hypothetical protein
MKKILLSSDEDELSDLQKEWIDKTVNKVKNSPPIDGNFMVTSFGNEWMWYLLLVIMVAVAMYLNSKNTDNGK